MKWAKSLEITSFVTVLLTCGAVLYYISSNTWRAPEPVDAERWAASVRGTTLPGGLVQADNGRRKILLALSTRCGFCEQNAGFYRSLSREKDRNWEVIAVFPEPHAEAEQYLRARAIGVSRVVSRRLREVNIVATPSVLLADANGKVIDAWAGVLDEGRARVVAAKLQGDSLPPENTK